MKKALWYSVCLHLIAMLIFTFSDSFSIPKNVDTSEPLMVDFVSISEKSASPKISLNPEKEDKIAKIKKEVSEPKPQHEEKKNEEPIKPKSEDKPKTVQEKIEKPIEKSKSIEENNQTEEKDHILKKKDPEKKVEKKDDKKQDNLEKKEKKEDKKNLEKEKKDKPKKDEKAQIDLSSKKNKKGDEKNKNNKKLEDLLGEIDKKDQDETESGANTQNLGPVVTASEIDAIRQKIYKCWIVPAGAKGAQDLTVDVDIELSPDGTVTKAKVVNQSRMKSDDFFKIAAESALRAVLDPNCNPLPVPKDKYKQWKNLTFSFNPKDMF